MINNITEQDNKAQRMIRAQRTALRELVHYRQTNIPAPEILKHTGWSKRRLKKFEQDPVIANENLDSILRYAFACNRELTIKLD